ncbi:MAG: hypothetical protein JWL81_401 [Verrucomicrobiales bacterium]|nr:hypothetical protein [Verrucomicrobiales bacterium]
MILEIPMPWLAGPREELIATGTPLTGPEGKDGLFLTKLPDGGLVGAAVAPPDLDPHAAARFLYSRMLSSLSGNRLQRIWNYIPGINAEGNGLENYRAFNAGRQAAFITAHGPDFVPRLPAASALGTNGGRMALCFLAGPGEPRHVENPEQVPAFEYPAEYGASPPSFARATTVSDASRQSYFLSGTASIKGHASLGADFAQQAGLTFDNVRLMFSRMALPPGTPGAWKIFLRHRADLPAAQAALAAAFPEALPDAMFLEADICRASLLLEVEATFHTPAALAARDRDLPDPSAAETPECFPN